MSTVLLIHESIRPIAALRVLQVCEYPRVATT